MQNETIVERLRTRAQIRANISTRKSVQEGKEDRLGLLLIEAADRIEKLERDLEDCSRDYDDLVMKLEMQGVDVADLNMDIYDRA